MGEVDGRAPGCGYHGLKFDVQASASRCRARPRCRPGAKVRSYPVQEKNNIVWIWMGDPPTPDPVKILDLSWLSDPNGR